MSIHRRTALSLILVLTGALMTASTHLNAEPAQPSGSDQQMPEKYRRDPPRPIPLAGGPAKAMVVERNVMVRMRDGVRLATNIFRPDGNDPHPVILVRTPYGMDSPDQAEKAQFYVKRGYVYAVQDVRGKYASEGDWNSNRSEAHDGSDTITWLGTQPWSSGKVGMTGGSYLGLVQDAVADQENPYLKCLVPMVSPLTLGREDLTEYDRISGYTGAETYSVNTMWAVPTEGRVTGNDRNTPAFDAAWDFLPRIDYPQLFGREMVWWPFLLTHRRGFWEEYLIRAEHGEWRKPLPEIDAWWSNYKEHYRKVNVPMLQVSGWYDVNGEAMLKMFQLVRKYAADSMVRTNQQIVMGPWTHRLGAKFGDLDFGPQAKFNADEVSVEWFDYWLKGEDNGVGKRAPVRVFVMGENRWREATDWPVPGTKFTRFYLHSGGSAHLSRGGGGHLSTKLPGHEGVDHYTYDPGNPTVVPTNSAGGPTDMSATENRDDVVVYTSDVLNAPMEVTGPLAAELYMATSAPSTDLMVRLVDVHPDGKAYALTSSTVPPFRTYWSKDVETTGDGTRIVKANIMLDPTSNVFEVGHRIRVEISSSWLLDGASVGLARYGSRGLNVEPGTEPYATRWNVAQQTIYHDKAHPSHIVLPVIPR